MAARSQVFYNVICPFSLGLYDNYTQVQITNEANHILTYLLIY